MASDSAKDLMACPIREKGHKGVPKDLACTAGRGESLCTIEDTEKLCNHSPGTEVLMSVLVTQQ